VTTLEQTALDALEGGSFAHAVDERLPVADLTALARAMVRTLARAAALI
jgi:hypothetical protein